MEKLNILITNHSRYPTGGLEIWGRRLAKGLMERGHQVMFCVKRDSELLGELQTGGFHVHAFPMRGDMDPRTVLPMARLSGKKASTWSSACESGIFAWQGWRPSLPEGVASSRASAPFAGTIALNGGVTSSSCVSAGVTAILHRAL